MALEEHQQRQVEMMETGEGMHLEGEERAMPATVEVTRLKVEERVCRRWENREDV